MPNEIIDKIIAIVALIGILTLISFLIPDNNTYIINNEETVKINDKELLDKIGQMLIIGFQGTVITKDSYIADAMKNLNVGGIILFDYDVPSKSPSRNIFNPEQTKELIKNLQEFAPTPLFIAIDAEGGYVNRLKPKYGFIEIPSAQEMGMKNTEETKETAIKLTNQFVNLGINTNFAPVVDININPENPVIGGIERSFSSNPEEVFEHALAFIQGHHQNNIITAIKHFPGHGSSEEDSHKGMVDITKTYQEKELIPYQKLIEKGVVDMIMTAHIINRDIDPDYPATLSSLFINNILRKQLKFDGVIVSDDMQMGAITEHYGFAEAIILAINAGCNLLIISNNNKIYDETAPYRAQEIIFEAVKNGKIPIENILESHHRIYELKKQFGIIK